VQSALQGVSLGFGHIGEAVLPRRLTGPHRLVGEGS
jgi:hypothetical protein